MSEIIQPRMLKNVKKVLVTGANGFIGRNILTRFISEYDVISFAKTASKPTNNGILYLKGDITDADMVRTMLQKNVPDVVIHCAGIAHQALIRHLPYETYDKVNNKAAVAFAKVAGEINPNLYFIFLSSVSVYGEKQKDTVNEKTQCFPSKGYGKSKLDAESGLKKLFEKGYLRKLDILRLAPVYSFNRKSNLEKRVCGPVGLFYLKYGTGRQKISILSKNNLLDFLLFRLREDALSNTCSIINVTDSNPCSFNEIIRTFKSQHFHRKKPMFTIPIQAVKLGSRIAGLFFPEKRNHFYSYCDKLVRDMVFDNSRMLATGFCPKYNLKTIFKNRT